MNKVTIIIGIVVISILTAIGVVTFSKTSVQTQTQVAGATPTLDGIDSPYMKINNNKSYSYYQPMAATSSVICSIRNPYGTSTLTNFRAFASSSAAFGSQTIDLSTSTTLGGSSSPAFVRAYPAGAVWYMSWVPQASTTNTQLLGPDSTLYTGASNNIIHPGEYVNFRIATATAGTFQAGYEVGACEGSFLGF